MTDADAGPGLPPPLHPGDRRLGRQLGLGRGGNYDNNGHYTRFHILTGLESPIGITSLPGPGSPRT